MNADLVRGLIRMGFYVGVHTEHGHDSARLDSIVDALAAPVIAAMGDSDEVMQPLICGDSRFPSRCVRTLGHVGNHVNEDGRTWERND